MSDKNGSLESAIQERLEANPDIVELNQKGMEASENYLRANNEKGKLEAKGQLTLDEQKKLKVLTAHVSELERTVEELRKAHEANARIMKSA